MNSRKWLPRLYPREWRSRYEEEFGALLEQRQVSLVDLLDVVLGAIDAHLHPWAFTKRISGMNAFRNTVLTVFCAFVGFILAGLGFYGMVDDSQFIPAVGAHLELALAWDLVAAASAVALGAAVIGALPIGLAVMRRAISAARKDLLLLAVPVIILGILAVWGCFVIAVGLGWLPFPLATGSLQPGQAMPAGNLAILATTVGMIVLGAIASAIAICLAVIRTEAGEQTIKMKGLTMIVEPYSFALLPSAVTTVAMAAMLVGTTSFGLLASIDAAQAFHDNFVSWLLIVAAMAACTVVAAAAIVRGFSLRAFLRDFRLS